jgi:SAM-dependent methyltransferase
MNDHSDTHADKNARPEGDASLGAGYFDDVYRVRADPWDFESSAYEAEKYRTTVEALGGRRFRRGFEIGCSIGVLSRMLAAQCGALLAVDVSEAPLARARERCADLPQVEFARMQVPGEFPAGSFDLVVMSEVGYYWSRDDLLRACDRIEAALEPGGVWLLVHWTPAVHDYPLRGDAVHDLVFARGGPAGAIRHLGGLRRETYRLDCFARTADVPPIRPAPSAAG